MTVYYYILNGIFTYRIAKILMQVRYYVVLVCLDSTSSS